MYGWRGRIGHICPSIWDTNMYEHQRVLPEGIIMVINTLGVQKLVQEELEMALGKMEEAARALAEEGAEVIIAGGDPLIALRGFGFDQVLIERLKAATGIPVTTTLTAAVSALKELGVRRVAFASPYTEGLVKKFEQFLADSGFVVAGSGCLNIGRTAQISRLPYHASYQLAKEVFRKSDRAEAIYLNCGRLPVVGNIQTLEDDLGIPVLTSVQVMTWWALKQLKIGEGVQGYGTLLKRIG